VAESFDSDAEGYERARPNYPDELIAQIAAVSRGPKMLDVGCGTGIATRQLQAAGYSVSIPKTEWPNSSAALVSISHAKRW
jgi:ubiquinone/menaquinone biosynthesis C-methylase UbiE